MRYFFNLINEQKIIPDEDGIEVSDLTNVETEAKAAIQEIMREGAFDPPSGDWKLQITTDAGATLMLIPLEPLLTDDESSGESTCSIPRHAEH